MRDINAEIRSHIDRFAVELERLVKSAAVAAVTQALGSDASPRASRPTRGASQTKPAKAAATKGRPTGSKRPPEEIARTVERLLAAIKSKPGQRIEEIGAALRTSTKKLALPAKKLIANKKIKTKGVKRATRYLPA